MRIQRYIAKDMRSALAQVREAMGPEAVILSSGTIGDQVEVVAAIDMEVARGVRRGTARRAAGHTRAENVERAAVRRASSQLSEALVPQSGAGAGSGRARRRCRDCDAVRRAAQRARRTK